MLFHILHPYLKSRAAEPNALSAVATAKPRSTIPPKLRRNIPFHNTHLVQLLQPLLLRFQPVVFRKMRNIFWVVEVFFFRICR